MTFVQLTRSLGGKTHPVWVNLDHVIRIEPHPSDETALTRIYFSLSSGDKNNPDMIYVTEEPDLILAKG